MIYKVCTKCNIEKTIDGFSEYFFKPKKDGTKKKSIRNICKECYNKRSKEFFQENPNYKKDWRKNNPEKVKAENLRAKPRTDKWRAENKLHLTIKKREYGLKNKQHIRNKKNEFSKQSRENLTDCYVRSVLAKRSNLKSIDFYGESQLIELKKIQLKLRRLCRISQN